MAIIHDATPRCNKSDHQSLEDLVKSDYNPDMKYKSLIDFPYLWVHTEIQNIRIWRFLLYFSAFWPLEPSNAKIISFLYFKFVISPVKIMAES